MFRKMLVCTDLSPASDALIRCAKDLKSIGVEEVILTHVIYVANTPGLEEMIAKDALPGLERQRKVLEDQGIQVALEMPFGLPAQTLVETAEKHDVSGILIGSHGKGILKAAALGSVTEKLLRLTRRPVLVARIAILRGDECQLACGTLFSSILYPTDFSEPAERALDYLARLAVETRSPVTVMHIHDEKHSDRENRQRVVDAVESLAEAKKERLKSHGVPEVAVELAFGDPAQEIVERAKKGHFSLIVMASQGKGVLREMVLGSVSNKVLRQAGLPVLIIPPARQ